MAGPKGGKKGNNANWFLAQEAKKGAVAKPSVKAPKEEYKEVNLPIVKVQMNSKKEDQHFNEALAFARNVSDARSTDIQTVHLNMKDELVFNMKQDEAFEALWKAGELMLLIAFPKNWKTMDLSGLELDEDDDLEDLEDEYERFDYLYENGMAVYEGK